MSGTFGLRFDATHIQSVQGSAWVTYKTSFPGDEGMDISHDCGSVRELEHVIKRMHSELDDVLKKAKLKFAAAQEMRAKKREIGS